MPARISSTKIGELEQRIGHRFKTHERLVRALTHASAARSSSKATTYERLEFLGDRVLGLCVAEILFRTFPKASEGELSVRLNALVSGKTCAEIADELGLHDFIAANADKRHLASKRMRSVRADVVESIIAAIYLDAGLEAAAKFVESYWNERIHEVGAGTRDSKTALQEWAHTATGATPRYDIIERSGPDHDPVFVVEVKIDGTEGAQGTGRSKRTAEQAAAQVILLREKVWVENQSGQIEENQS